MFRPIRRGQSLRLFYGDSALTAPQYDYAKALCAFRGDAGGTLGPRRRTRAFANGQMHGRLRIAIRICSGLCYCRGGRSGTGCDSLLEDSSPLVAT